MHDEPAPRDPRRDPIPGDVLGIGRTRYHVVPIHGGVGHVVQVGYQHRRRSWWRQGDPFTGRLYLATLHAWRRMMRSPEVIVHAAGASTHVLGTTPSSSPTEPGAPRV